MTKTPPNPVVLLTVEIEIPGGLEDELVDALVDDLAYETHLERLQNLIKRWAGFVTGQPCHVSIDVE